MRKVSSKDEYFRLKVNNEKLNIIIGVVDYNKVINDVSLIIDMVLF